MHVLGWKRYSLKETQIKHGMRQGCVLSPCLTNLSAEIIIREGKNGVNIEGMNINNLRYAEDTVLLAENQ